MALELGPGEFDKLLTPTFVTNFGEFCLTLLGVLYDVKSYPLCGGHVRPFILTLYHRLNCLGFS